MAVLSRGQTYGVTETITNTKLHNLVDLGSVTAIMDADIDGSANIQDTKLEDITTGNKVSGSSFFNLASTPSGAGVFPYVNIPSASLVSIPNISIVPIALASWVSGYSFKELASTPSGAGQFPYYNVASSMASGALPVYDGSRNFVAKNPTQIFQNLSNVIFSWSSMADAGATTTSTSYVTKLTFQFTKISGISTITMRVRGHTADTGGGVETCWVKVDIGGQNNETSMNSTTPAWMTAVTIDVSGLTNGTTYNGIVQLKMADGLEAVSLDAVTLVAS